MIYCPTCARLKRSPEPWCIACGTILDPVIPEADLPPEVAGSLEIGRELLAFEVKQTWVDWFFVPAALLAVLVFWMLGRPINAMYETTWGLIVLMGGFLPFVLFFIAWFFLRRWLGRRFPPTRVRVGQNERGVMVYHITKWNETRRLKINLAAIERLQVATGRRGEVFLHAEREGRWENLLPYQAFGGPLPAAVRFLGEIAESLRTTGRWEPVSEPRMQAQPAHDPEQDPVIALEEKAAARTLVFPVERPWLWLLRMASPLTYLGLGIAALLASLDRGWVGPMVGILLAWVAGWFFLPNLWAAVAGRSGFEVAYGVEGDALVLRLMHGGEIWGQATRTLNGIARIYVYQRRLNRLAGLGTLVGLSAEGQSRRLIPRLGGLAPDHLSGSQLRSLAAMIVSAKPEIEVLGPGRRIQP